MSRRTMERIRLALPVMASTGREKNRRSGVSETPPAKRRQLVTAASFKRGPSLLHSRVDQDEIAPSSVRPALLVIHRGDVNVIAPAGLRELHRDDHLALRDRLPFPFADEGRGLGIEDLPADGAAVRPWRRNRAVTVRALGRDLELRVDIAVRPSLIPRTASQDSARRAARSCVRRRRYLRLADRSKVRMGRKQRLHPQPFRVRCVAEFAGLEASDLESGILQATVRFRGARIPGRAGGRPLRPAASA